MTDGNMPMDGFPFSDDNAPSMDDVVDSSTTSSIVSLDGFTFDTIVGFDEEIARLRELGIVDEPDSDYIAFVEQMKAQHGLYDEPIGSAVLFCCDVREDADRLMLATANELKRPTIRMRVVEGPSGMQALCVMSTPGLSPEGFTGPGTLVLEGIDLWGAPAGVEMSIPHIEAIASGSSSGALKAISLIRSSAANPEVSVFASACEPISAHSPIAMLIGPMTVFEIPAPDSAERDAIWDHLMDKHVSMSALDRHELVNLSRGMPRCDIFSAAREAVSQAYHASIEGRSYVPVSRSNLLDKIAAYQPIDSDEYRQIEDSVVEDFLFDLERYERGEN